MTSEEDRTPVLELGDVYERCEHQGTEENIPFVPHSFANLDLARLTIWGWALLLGSALTIAIPAIAVGQLLGIRQIPYYWKTTLAILYLGLWGAFFIGGRAILETRNVTVVRRKKETSR